ncbi:MAG: DeoR/GlpR family DNA-binding transcription regulator [Pseudomonadota bacterium]|nr:DeoR/GlpR family DNA-binding transcription regulator [Pseudomonadota bacterium]
MARRLQKDERRARILDALRYTPHLRIASLAQQFEVTTETVRRDLDALSEMGLVDRAHGGAVARPMGIQPSISEREQSTVDERRRIAVAAAGLVSPGQVVMIDAGSTTTQLAWQLGAIGEGLTVITNSYPVASALAAGSLRSILCPGDFNGREGGVFGQDTSEFLSRFHGNVAFIGASGIAADGISDVNREATWVKRVMLARCERVYLLADHTKFNVRVLEVVAPLDHLDGIVTDQAPQGPLAEQLRKAEVEVHLAPQVSSAGRAAVNL